MGDDADRLVEAAATTEKAAAAAVGDVYGESYKSSDSPTIAELMELWEAYKEAEAEETADEETADGDQLWDDLPNYEAEAAKMDSMAELKAGMMSIDKTLKGLMDILAGRGGDKNEDEGEKKKEAAAAAQIAALEAQIATLKGDAPRAASGYRASLNAAPIEDTAPDFLAQREKAAQGMGPAAQLYEAAEQLTAGLFGK